MDKRLFLKTAALGAAALPLVKAQAADAKAGKGPAVLTVTGAVSKPNRGALDSALDQMMVKQKVAFDKAHTFDFAALLALPAVTIKPTLEYDNKVHTLRGPLLVDVLKAAGTPTADGSKVLLQAVDGYAVVPTFADIQKYRFIIATHLDGQPMPLGGLGPVWAVYDADRFPDMAAKPISDRFALCPWGCYHIDVQAA